MTKYLKRKCLICGRTYGEIIKRPFHLLLQECWSCYNIRDSHQYVFRKPQCRKERMLREDFRRIRNTPLLELVAQAQKDVELW